MRERDIDTEKERIHVRYMMSSFRHAHSLGEAAQVQSRAKVGESRSLREWCKLVNHN